uniref:Uncharacterized protein n=1 Tax=Paraburkholderia sprentiae WSM5005 TaxID=754502 RepID=A0A1I9YRI4_9BURK
MRNALIIALIDPVCYFDGRAATARVKTNANKRVVLVLVQRHLDVPIDRPLHSLQVLLQQIARAGNCDCLTKLQIVIRKNKVTAADCWVSPVITVHHQNHAARYWHINM